MQSLAYLSTCLGLAPHLRVCYKGSLNLHPASLPTVNRRRSIVGHSASHVLPSHGPNGGRGGISWHLSSDYRFVCIHAGMSSPSHPLHWLQATTSRSMLKGSANVQGNTSIRRYDTKELLVCSCFTGCINFGCTLGARANFNAILLRFIFYYAYLIFALIYLVFFISFILLCFIFHWIDDQNFDKLFIN